MLLRELKLSEGGESSRTNGNLKARGEGLEALDERRELFLSPVLDRFFKLRCGSRQIVESSRSSGTLNPVCDFGNAKQIAIRVCGRKLGEFFLELLDELGDDVAEFRIVGRQTGNNGLVVLCFQRCRRCFQ